jgi:malate dehydrogenase
MKISIIGRGDFMFPVASAICQPSLVAEVMLVDNNRRGTGETLQDLQEAIASVGSDTRLLSSSDLAAVSESEIVVLLPPSPIRLRLTQAQRRSNASLVRHSARVIKQHAPRARVLVAIPPAAALAYLVYRELEADSRQVIGLSGGIASAYLKRHIASKLCISVRDVTTLVIGNDEIIYPLPQYCRVNGIPIDQLLSAGQIRELTAAANDQHKRAYVDGPYSLSVWISQIVVAIALDKKRIMTVSALIKAGASEVYLSIPTKIGKDGAEEIIQIDLTDSQREQFTKLVASSMGEQHIF